MKKLESIFYYCCKENKAYILLLFCLIFSSGLFAATYTVETVPNVRLKNKTHYVSNPDNILSAPIVKQINQQLHLLEEGLSIEVAVVALESINGVEPRLFARELFQKWGIGKKEDDNGLLILLLTTPEERSITFETGYGLESVLPDNICYRIQQKYMIPLMKNGDFSGGIREGVSTVVTYLNASDYERKNLLSVQKKMTYWDWIEIIFLISLCLLLVVFIYRMFRLHFFPKGTICQMCMQKSVYRVSSVTLQKATYTSGGVKEETCICKNCGHEIIKRINTPLLVKSQRRSSGYRRRPSSSYRSGFTSSRSTSRSSTYRSSSSRSSSSSSRSTGRSYGGGRSGGGGASSRF